jgi:multiple sugar transport system substrate-binding protein
MKKILSILVVAFMFVTLFAGFASARADKTIIKFGAQQDSTPATKAMVAAYNASQSKYEVQWVTFTNDSAQMHDQLLTSLSGGSGEYDVISMDVVWAGEFAGAGYLAPLDKRISDAGLKKTDFNSGSMAAGNYMGKQYTLPFFPDLGLLYYRSDIVSKADAAKLVSGKYTYNDIINMATKYKGKGKTTDGFVYQSKQYEGLVCNATEFTKGFKNIKNGLLAMKQVSSSKIVPKDILKYTEGETHTSFITGKSVFARNWPYQYGMLTTKDSKIKPSQVGVAPLPNGGSVVGWLLGVNKDSKNIEGAWDFIKYAAGKEGQKIMSTQGGYLPGFNALLNDSSVLAANKMLQFEGFKNAIKTTISRPVSPEYSKASDTIQINVHKYLSGGQDLNATVTAIQNALK